MSALSRIVVRYVPRSCFSWRRYLHQLRVFLIAGEPSGDVIGSRLMDSLKQLHHSAIKFSGIGGPLMEKQGMTSEFSMDDLSVMGAVELLPHLLKLRARLQQTLVAAELFKPDIFVAIDSKGFSFRVLKWLTAKYVEQQWKLPLRILYVAPSVWAWKGGETRLQKWIGVIDHVLCILPFEKSLCEGNGLAATFVGHPVLEDAFFDSSRATKWTSNWHIEGDKATFFSEHGLTKGTTMLTLLPGSRLQEVKRMMPIYRETLEMLKNDISDLAVAIPITFSGRLIQKVESELSRWDMSVVLLPGATLKQKYDAFHASEAGLCTSGTVVLQMQMARLPCVVAFRANLITEWLVKRSTQLRYISLPNILLDSPIIPEAVFSDCNPHRLVGMLRRVLLDDALRERQTTAADTVMGMLSPVEIETLENCQTRKQTVKPSIAAARAILNLFETKDKNPLIRC